MIDLAEGDLLLAVSSLKLFLTTPTTKLGNINAVGIFNQKFLEF